MVKKLISITFFFFLFTFNIYADSLKLNSDKYIVYNLDENRIITSKNPYDKSQIASLTKIMTVIIGIENVSDYDKKVTITEDMLEGLTWDITKAGFKVGEEYTYNDLFYASMLPSAADAVNAIALSISGSYSEYIKLMNNKVMELGLLDTHYSNVIGLTDEKNYSSAYDVVMLLKYALKNKKFEEIFKTKTYTMSNGKTIKTTVSKLDSKYILGSKTGYTSASGRCLASISNINNTNLIIVTLKNDTKDLNYISETINAYKYYDENYSYKNIIDSNDIITEINTKYSKNDKYNVTVDKVYESFLDNDFNKNELSYEYDGINEISYFTRKGKSIGKVKVLYNNEVLKEIELLYDGSLNLSLIKLLKGNFVIVIVGVIFISLLIFAKYYKLKNN